MPKAPSNETPAQKLVRLANGRVNKILKSFEQIGNLGNYKPTSQQIQKIESAIEAAAKLCAKKLRGETVAASGFQL